MNAWKDCQTCCGVGEVGKIINEHMVKVACPNCAAHNKAVHEAWIAGFKSAAKMAFDATDGGVELTLDPNYEVQA